MTKDSDIPSLVRLNIGGKKFWTTIDTLTQREPDSMLAAMFSGRHTMYQDSEKGYVFVDRDGKQFRHVLNWLRDGIVPTLTDSEYLELLREAEYYQLLGLIDGINAVINKRKEADELATELTRTDIIKCIQSERVRFRGINLSGLDLSKLDLSFVDFSYACLKNVFFSRANLQCAKFRDVDAEASIFHNATLRASKGSLEENLTGKKKDKYVLSWEVRFNISVGIAEALNYLHSECSQPVIHRDVKSSNILLSDGFEPQLSDFGLAIWGPTTSSFLTQSDVVGTFGYLAPEYFMYGKVSDKIDVYAFGVVLLELLSGRKPICSETPKGQESLVMWAKPMIESGDVKGILDPELGEKFDEVQIQRMVLAATLCLTQAARLRPKMREVLKLLRGDYEIRNCMNSQHEDPENQDCIDDEVYPNSSAELHLGLALLDTEDASTSFSSMEQSNNLSPEEYLRKRLSPSSSFD